MMVLYNTKAKDPPSLKANLLKTILLQQFFAQDVVKDIL